jgi:RimJ/RimL family protein N-acetyltransferase
VESCAWFVAEVDGAPAGIAAGCPSPERTGLISMWVDPAHRGRRLADALIGAVLAWAVDEGARELTLWVADGNEAATRAYARAGFAPTGRRQPLPSDPAVGEEEWAHPLDRRGNDRMPA